SGLGLPDRDYYLQDDPKFKQIREQYVTHIAKMLELAGGGSAQQDAKAIMALETALARKHWTRVESRDADKTYNKFEVAKLKTLAPNLDWDVFLNETGIMIPVVT